MRLTQSFRRLFILPEPSADGKPHVPVKFRVLACFRWPLRAHHRPHIEHGNSLFGYCKPPTFTSARPQYRLRLSPIVTERNLVRLAISLSHASAHVLPSLNTPPRYSTALICHHLPRPNLDVHYRSLSAYTEIYRRGCCYFVPLPSVSVDFELTVFPVEPRLDTCHDIDELVLQPKGPWQPIFSIKNHTKQAPHRRDLRIR